MLSLGIHLRCLLCNVTVKDNDKTILALKFSCFRVILIFISVNSKKPATGLQILIANKVTPYHV
jgi:hypothetical protein